MSSKIRIAILGYGRSGSQLHAGAIAANLDRYEMVAACDIDPARRDQAAERFGCKVYDDYHQMLAAEQLDMVSIVTRSDQHCEMTCDVLKAGVDVLVTKPWAVNAAEGERMIATEQATGRRIYPWLPARWGSDVRRLRQLLADKAIGDVFIIRRAVCAFGTRCDWQMESKFGGGYLLNWGAHIVDPPVLITGSKVASVYGRLKLTINPGDTEDVFYAVMNLADGTVVQAEYTIATESLPGWFIQGTRGTIVVNGREMTIHAKTPARPDDPTKFSTMQADEGAVTETLEGSPWGDEAEIYRDLANSRQGGPAYPIVSADALEISRVFDAIKLANRENRVVTLG